MVKKITSAFKKFKVNRTTVLLLVFAVMSFILVRRLFELQIINGQKYANNFSLRTTKERTINSTRGNIYDRNGKVLAYNELSYSVTLENSGTYKSSKDENFSLNKEIYDIIQLIESKGDGIDAGFHIVIDENGDYAFDVEDFALSRFRADVYGHNLIEKLTEEEQNSSATEMIDYLAKGRFGLIFNDKASKYEKDNSTKEEDRAKFEVDKAEYELPNEYSKEELLKVLSIRYALWTTSYKKYVPVTIATNVNEQTIAAITENKDTLVGVDIQEDSARIYNDSLYFAAILGYTGKASTEELELLREERSDYSNGAVVGKTGIEEAMETTLQGKAGTETVYVDNLGKVLKIDNQSVTKPVQGHDVHLTIDSELQIATYKMLEQRIAGILIMYLQNIKEFKADDTTDQSNIPIPVYDAYHSLVNNNIIDINHFTANDATKTEKDVLGAYIKKQDTVFAAIREELTGDKPTIYKKLSKEMQAYVSYIVNDLLTDKTGILKEATIDKSDSTYIAWKNDDAISLQAFLTYAASQNWIDLSDVVTQDEYFSSKEVYHELSTYIANYLKTDATFSKMLYKYLLQEDKISGTQLLNIAYDQGVLSKEDGDYANFISGQMNSYELMIEKIRKLDITPAQLALDPCSGSAIITDPKTGEIRACVTYPSYDNNRLANQMDVEYYKQLTSDLSEPFYNKATQQRTAPGSVFKIVTAVAGLKEGVIGDDSYIICSGVFDKISGSPLGCWNFMGHGALSIREAITQSCNVFFSEVAYRMGQDESNVFSDPMAVQKIQTYATLFDLDKNSGIEISEADPHITDKMPIPSAIGQGTHNFTTSQLGRYITTIANSGTSYDISLLDKVTDSSGNMIEDFTPRIQSKLEVSKSIWDDVHVGMRGVITETNKSFFEDLNVELAGKTGTAQEAKNRANHGLFIGYAPYQDPEMAVAVRIAYGYSSLNAAVTAKDICNYYFDLKPDDELITGKAMVPSTSDVQRTD